MAIFTLYYTLLKIGRQILAAACFNCFSFVFKRKAVHFQGTERNSKRQYKRYITAIISNFLIWVFYTSTLANGYLIPIKKNYLVVETKLQQLLTIWSFKWCTLSMLPRCTTYLEQHKLSLQRSCSLQKDDNFSCWFFVCLSTHSEVFSFLLSFIFVLLHINFRKFQDITQKALDQDERNQVFPE